MKGPLPPFAVSVDNEGTGTVASGWQGRPEPQGDYICETIPERRNFTVLVLP
jgi:hypothetical protein